MVLTSERVEIAAPAGRVIRAVVVRPRASEAARRLPAVLAYSDIFQLTGPHVRVCERLAGYGYVVVLPEIFARLGLGAVALDFERDRQLALDSTERMELAWFDEDRATILGWLRAQPDVDAARLLACGWCIGGHLAFRAAQEADIKATRDLIRAGQLLKIDVLDHVIIGRASQERPKDYVSLRELGYFY